MINDKEKNWSRYGENNTQYKIYIFYIILNKYKY